MFFRWFTNAVNVLRLLPRGDGGIAAFMITLPLVERAAIGRLKLRGEESGKDNANVKTEIGVMLGLTDEYQRSVFWDMFRNGFMHLGMPLDGKTKWLFSGEFGHLPVFRDIKGTHCICLDPWKFADHILSFYHAEPKLIAASESAPFGDIFYLES